MLSCTLQPSFDKLELFLEKRRISGLGGGGEYIYQIPSCPWNKSSGYSASFLNKKESKALDFFIRCAPRLPYETEIRAERVSVSNRALFIS